MPNCTTSLAASQSPNPHCSSLHLRLGSIGATKSTAHLNPKMSNLFLADPIEEKSMHDWQSLSHVRWDCKSTYAK